RFPGSAPKNSRFDFTGNFALNLGRIGCFSPPTGRSPLNLRNSRFFSLIDGNLTAEIGSIPTASTTTHSRFFPTCGDAPKMPANGRLFQCVLRVSRSPEGADGRFGP